MDKRRSSAFIKRLVERFEPLGATQPKTRGNGRGAGGRDEKKKIISVHQGPRGAIGAARADATKTAVEPFSFFLSFPFCIFSFFQGLRSFLSFHLLHFASFQLDRPAFGLETWGGCSASPFDDEVACRWGRGFGSTENAKR